MKLATYNIWNTQRGLPQREHHIIEQIKQLDVQLIVLQEVKNLSLCNKIQEAADFPYATFYPHDGRVVEVEPWKDNEGIAVLSHYPIIHSEYTEYAMISVIQYHETRILIANVHLPWDSVLAQEKCIIQLNRRIMEISAEYRIIAGDFNCSQSSSVHHFLKGYRSLHEEEVKPYWTDLAEVAQEFLSVIKEPTLNLSENPRWKDQRITDHSARVDCIFIHDCYPNPYPSLDEYSYFGQEIYCETGLCASDHYGVVATLNFPCESEN